MENMEFGTVSTSSMLLILLTAILAIALPLIAAIIWCKKKHEPFTTVLIGAATFMLFAIVLEKPLQNILIFPVQMGLPEHAASVFINARPVLWAFLVGFFVIDEIALESGHFIFAEKRRVGMAPEKPENIVARRIFLLGGKIGFAGELIKFVHELATRIIVTFVMPG